MGSELLVIGGRAGVGKKSAAWEMSSRLRSLEVSHCYIDGNFLDQAHPAPPDDPRRTAMTERNLASLWANYRDLRYRRLIYTNVVSIVETDMLSRAMGDRPRVTAVLLTASDDTAATRLTGREIGSELEPHLRRSREMARYLDEHAPEWVHRVATDGRGVRDVTAEIIAHTGWTVS